MTGSPLLAWPGAVPAGGPDAGVAAHYGNPFAEQRAVAEAAGLVDLSHRSVVTVSGPDRLRWLDDLLSQRLRDLGAGEGRDALLLDPQGHVEAHVRLVDDGTTTWALGEPGAGATLVAFLERMKFLLQVTVTEATETRALLAVVGPRARDVLSSAAVPAGTWVAPRRWPADSVDVCVPRADLVSVSEALRDAGATPVGAVALEAIRVAAGEPRLGLDTDARTIPNEVSWLHSAVDLHKGCYRGQETVARVHALGRPPRRLVLVHLDGASEDLPVPGAAVRRGEAAVGHAGTAVRHWELGQVALVMLRRSAVTPGLLDVDLPDGGRCTAAVDPDWLTVTPLPGEGAGRRAQQGLKGGAPPPV